jgi:hypothetical protein
MNIQYFEPMSRGFARMKKALFSPFDLKKWFVVGFTAFLSGLTDWHGGGEMGKKGGTMDWEGFLYFPQRAVEWLTENPIWAVLIAIGVLLLLILAVFIAWWSARGKFMFLDNVAHDRSQVVAPWKEYRAEGNSLFLLSLLLAAIVFVIVTAYAVQCFTSLLALYESSEDVRALIGPAILMVLGLIAIFLLVGFISLLLRDFVVPIMYKERITVLKAIRKFFPLLLSELLYFLGYAVFKFFVVLVVVIGVIVVGLATCCVGFLLFAIPYINAVVLLPVSYTLRAFSVEFLEQFGPEYHIFPRVSATPASTETTIA